MGILEYLLTQVGDLIWTSVKREFHDRFKKLVIEKRVHGQVEECVAELADSLEAFFRDEKLPVVSQKILVDTCVSELQPLLQNPKLLLKGGLDGKAIYAMLYPNEKHPKVIEEEGIGLFYALLFPRVAHVVCRIPGVVAKWEKEAWGENFGLLADLRRDVARVEKRIVEAGAAAKGEDDDLFVRLRKSMALDFAFKIDLTSLHPSRPEAARLDEIFVLPDLIHRVGNLQHRVSDPNESVRVFLASSSRILVVGAPGAGKSSWAIWLHQIALAKTAALVVRIRLREYNPSALPTVAQIITTAAGEHISALIEKKNLTAWINAGAFVFIVDGFDEVSPTHRDEVLAWINRLAVAAPKSPLILTSRPITTDHLNQLSGWSRWEMQPFDKPRIKDYIERWYKCMVPVGESESTPNAGALAEKWINDPVISHLTGNPLMLGTVLMVNRLDGSLPDGRAKLYQRYVEGMLGIWDDRRNVSAASINLKLDQKHRVLTRIALRLHLKDEDQISDAELLPLISLELTQLAITSSPEAVLDQLRERSGLLVGPGSYSFIHKSVGEFLVAQAVDDGSALDEKGNRVDRWRLWQERSNDRWNTVIFLWAGLCKVSELVEFVNRAIEEKDSGDDRLALGLIYDQWSRFVSPTAASLFAKALTVRESKYDAYVNYVAGFREGDDDGYASYLLPFGAEIAFVIPVLRGLGEIHLDDAVDDLAKCGRICWSDLSQASSFVKSNLWIQFVTSCETTEKLVEAFCDSETIANLPEGATLFVFFWIGGLLREASETTESIKERLELAAEYFPDLTGCIPVNLLERMVTFSNLEEEAINDGIRLEVVNGMRAVHAMLTTVPSDEWLKATFNAVPYEPYDLLIATRTILENLSKIKVANLGPVIDDVYSYVNSLIDRRSKEHIL